MAAKKISYWLFKEEPGCYSYSQLEKDGKTLWDGVTNNLAQKNLRQVKKGDKVFFYHTGKEKAVVGEMVVVSDLITTDEEKKRVAVEVEPVKRLTPVTLAQIKAEEDLREWDLVKLSRLSIVPVTSAQWKQVLKMSRALEKAAREE